MTPPMDEPPRAFDKAGQHSMNVGLPVAALILLIDTVMQAVDGQFANALIHAAALSGVLGALEYIWKGKR